MEKSRALEIAIEIMNSVDDELVEEGVGIDLDELDEAVNALEDMRKEVL